MPVLNIRQHIVASSLGLTVISAGLLLASPAMALTAEEVNPIYQTNFTEDQGISPGQNPGSYAYYFDTKRPNKIINALGFAVFDDWTPFNYPQGSTYDIYIWKYVGDSTGDVVFTPLLANPITFDVNNTSIYVFKDGFYWIPTKKINLGSETFSDPLTGFAVSAVGDFGSEVTGLPILLNGSGSFAPQFAWDGSGLNGPGSYFYPEFPLPLDYEGLFPTDRYGYFNANASFDSSQAVPGPLPVIGAAAAFGWSRRLRWRLRLRR